MYKRKIPQRLRWQAEGAHITKTCDSHCIVTHDQTKIEHANIVVMEVDIYLSFQVLYNFID